ncbi:MAG TPA: ABC transporter ATP-binding protein, partial [Candidatus Polarisedimenticolaceae bacterium]|nr:ABC transporter ATP-binding protein [Candidatus Polarisedimenticolaceae bacterium]
PNGAGKSTLIHCIMGLAIPTSGSGSVFGHDIVDDYQEARRLCGLAPQEINMDWFLTVEDTLDFHGGYYGMTKAERKPRIDELLETFSLTEKRKAKTLQLSGGMKRRVMLARAMMHNPKVLILDEPTAGVDVELRLELWQYMQKINKAGTTILLTTHYIEEAENLCSQIALINKGEIVEEGTSDQLKKRFGKKTLEDVYLAVIGREELARVPK